MNRHQDDWFTFKCKFISLFYWWPNCLMSTYGVINLTQFVTKILHKPVLIWCQLDSKKQHVKQHSETWINIQRLSVREMHLNVVWKVYRPVVSASIGQMIVFVYLYTRYFKSSDASQPRSTLLDFSVGITYLYSGEPISPALTPINHRPYHHTASPVANI